MSTRPEEFSGDERADAGGETENDPQIDRPTKASEVRLVIVDDHTVMRQGIRIILEKLCKFVVVGEAADGQAAIDVTRSLRPHVVLMDVTMPVMTGIDATRQITSDMPSVRVIALTMHNSQEMRQAMKAAGAVDFITKSADASEVCATILRAATAAG